jgi:hypothetical protein
MLELLNNRPRQLYILLQSKHPSSLKCIKCSKESIWKCLDCVGSPIYCSSCCCTQHNLDFRHRIVRWNGEHFTSAWLANVGIVIYLGHNGERCPWLLQPEIFPQTNEQPDVYRPFYMPSQNVAIDKPIVAALDDNDRQSKKIVHVQNESTHIPSTPNGSEIDIEMEGPKTDSDHASNHSGCGSKIDSPLEKPNMFNNQATNIEADGPATVTEEWPSKPFFGDTNASSETSPSSSRSSDRLSAEDDGVVSELGPEWIARETISGHKILIVVDHTGLHPVLFHFCECPTGASRSDQLMEMGFFPATSARPRTVFTFSALDDYQLDNQECKTAAFSYFEKLQRKTNSAFPQTVLVGVSPSQSKKG